MKMNANEQQCSFIILIKCDNPKFIRCGFLRAKTTEEGLDNLAEIASSSNTPTTAPTLSLIFY